MKQAALKRNQNFKKTHKLVVIEQLKLWAPHNPLVKLITSYCPAGKTFQPPFCGRLIKRRASSNCRLADTLLNKAVLSKATHL
jgi:hypothetical protein